MYGRLLLEAGLGIEDHNFIFGLPFSVKLRVSEVSLKFKFVSTWSVMNFEYISFSPMLFQDQIHR